ncbi:hypothetical protein [Tabrizicola sp.]|uniref:hypothetical protein n=1 Tax=Tabrizicola sp. TaxID=2005166 RepID=UPI003F357A92
MAGPGSDRGIALAERRNRGEPVPQEAYPSEAYYMYPNSKKGRQPDVFAASLGYVVSDAVATILRTADLGRTGLFPLALRQHDRITPVDGTYFILHIGETKTAVLPEQSSGLVKP